MTTGNRVSEIKQSSFNDIISGVMDLPAKKLVREPARERVAEAEAPTGNQIHAIARLAMQLGIREGIEETVKTKEEAAELQYSLLRQLRAKNNKKRFKG